VTLTVGCQLAHESHSLLVGQVPARCNPHALLNQRRQVAGGEHPRQRLWLLPWHWLRSWLALQQLYALIHHQLSSLRVDT